MLYRAHRLEVAAEELAEVANRVNQLVNPIFADVVSCIFDCASYQTRVRTIGQAVPLRVSKVVYGAVTSASS